MNLSGISMKLIKFKTNLRLDDLHNPMFSGMTTMLDPIVTSSKTSGCLRIASKMATINSSVVLLFKTEVCKKLNIFYYKVTREIIFDKILELGTHAFTAFVLKSK